MKGRVNGLVDCALIVKVSVSMWHQVLEEG